MRWLLDLFIPNKNNNFKARILKPQILSLLTLVFISYQILFNFVTLANPLVLGYSSNITPERIIELTNLKRASVGLQPLKENPLLSEAARRKAADMFAFNYWAHNSPSGRDPWSFFKEVGYKYLYAGENLARDFQDPESVVEAWMNSPSHRENIINSKYLEIGVAVVDGSLLGTQTTLVVQLFGTPQISVASKPKKETVPQQVVAQKPAVLPKEEKKLTEEKVVQIPQLPTSQVIIEQKEKEYTPLVNPFSLTKIIGVFTIGVICGAFLIDLLVVSERKTPRLSSRSFAQLLFLGFIILLALVSQQGAIL